MEQKHARAAQNIIRTHPPFFKITWRLRNCPGITTSYRTDSRTEHKLNRDLTLHSSEQKTGSSELWNLMTSRIVCCLATLGSKNSFQLAFSMFLCNIILYLISDSTKTIRLLALNFYEMIVDSGFALINYHLIEMSSS